MTLTLVSRSHKMLPSSIHIMWPMHLQTLKLLCPMVQKTHLQKNTLFDLDPKVKVTWSVALYPLHYVTYAQAKFEVAVSKSLWDVFTRKYIIWPLTLTLGSRSHKTSPSTLDIMWPMHRRNLKLLLPKVYEEMHLQEKTLFELWPWPWGQGHTKCHPVPSISCDLCIYKVRGCYVQRFRRRYNYKKRDGRTDRRTDRRTTDRLWYEINIPYFSNEKAGIIKVASSSIFPLFVGFPWLVFDLLSIEVF